MRVRVGGMAIVWLGATFSMGFSSLIQPVSTEFM